MKLTLAVALLASASAFSPARFSTRAAARPTRVEALARVIEDPLPKVYVYDHCPFCVRVRLALGLKNVKHEVVFMGNDDVATPTKLVGKKVAPILEMPADSHVMGESLDIIAYFDEKERFGPVGLFKPASGRKDLKAWQKGLQETLRCLTRPRYMQTALPEFMQQDGKDYFVKGHQIPPYEKADWKSSLSMDEQWGLYNQALAETDKYLPDLNKGLAELEGLIFSEEFCTEGGLSYDDIDLWSRLRSITLVKGAVFPPKVTAYLKNLEKAGDVPLYFNMQV
mmetsp:Transcript_44672/g.100855  ORF Transcript_44672/g.100855 Transcript_44672/m.100855 type:complete len:281 (-) Transcript_44672:393-1235(-)|eukprot:CAMPEP_0172616648 /NCGR_PEP_ID=MMETSP1068-20121228/66404_1 /TAXON_ID=35684 /ORGANISM="Pseudopedinella elastica, Strain CCMP716" /LENGTH=280 /DNA_ID=CAMNT_0013422149 /DNA_START=54 /DNA_END=896 /DNA_ORIENTATION=-